MAKTSTRRAVIALSLFIVRTHFRPRFAENPFRNVSNRMITDRAELIASIREKINPTGVSPAVVFNCHITGLEVARSLGARGIPIIALDRDEKGYGLHSRFTTVAGKCPYPLEDERGFIDLLLEIGATLKQKAVLFPCLDEWVFAVARHREEMERFFFLPFSEYRHH